MKTLVVFDFDHTLVDENCDVWVIRSAPGQRLPAWLEDTYQRGRWTDYMGRIMSYLGDQSVRPDTIRSVMETIPLTEGMLELLSFISENKKDVDCIIVSDANTLFIDWIIQTRGVKAAFHSVFSNPASVDQRGYVGLQGFHTHQCEKCPVNMCKQKVLRDFRETQADSGVHYDSVCYVGDGGNDFCPVKILKETDVVMPRKGYTLEKMLNKAQQENKLIRPQVVSWSSGQDILQQLRVLIQ